MYISHIYIYIYEVYMVYLYIRLYTFFLTHSVPHMVMVKNDIHYSLVAFSGCIIIGDSIFSNRPTFAN